MPSPILRARVAAALLLFPLIGVAVGCASAVPPVDPAADAARAVGLDESIRFVRDGGPVDVDASSPAQLPRVEAVRRSMHSSPEVQAALAEVQAALADSRQARTLSNPILDVSVRFAEGGGSEVIEASLSQNLAALLSRPARSRAADARLRAAAADVVREALELLAAVERTYAEAQAADQRLAVLNQQAITLESLLEIAQARQRAGESGRLDAIGFQARRAALAADALQVQSERRAARLTLARLVGRPSSAAEWELDEWTRQPAPAAAEAQWLAVALERRPEVQAAAFELVALGEDVRLASLSSFDDLAVGAELERDEDLSFGPAASVPIPLFDLGGQRRALAQAERSAARHRLTGVKRQVVEEVRQALAAADAARRAVELVDVQLLPLQRDRLQQTRAAYTAGLTDVTDVLLAEQDLLDAQSRLVDARRRSALAAADLRRAAGGVATPEVVPTIQSASQVTTSPVTAPAIQ